MIMGHSIADSMGNILAMDARVCDFLHRPLIALVGTSYVELTHPHDLGANVRRIAEIGDGGGAVGIRKRYLRPEGITGWVDLQVSRLTTGSDRGRLLGTLMLSNIVEPAADPRTLWRQAQRLIRVSDVRRDALGCDLAGDYAWIAMLHIYMAEAEGRSIDIDAVANATGMDKALTARWISALRIRGVVEDESFGPAIQLSTEGLASVERILRAAA